ncbi:OmpA family protein [Pelomonas sp. Root1237]|uniref:OmpA family protein n=1 Tax=Pelomonas sp. Root1237 TaxID=1736434 RepID=UPI0009E770C6|nr:OmpA family protein [Pelomonas sp. Root1237]
MRSSKIPLRSGATATLIVAALLAAGCSSMSEREQGTAKGAGAGAVAGAIIGSVTGGSAGRGAVIGGAVGAVAGNLWSKRMEDKRAALAQASQGTGVEVARTDDNRLKLNVPSDVSFDTGRADIKPQMRPVLDEIGRNLDPGVHVTVVGHTDSTGSDAINEPLSRERAAAVRDYLSARGVSSSRVTVAGRGSHEPVAGNDTEAGRAANRRVEIFLAEQG